jgi:1-acyl-sn-glycerol-3-phosphate acyltransferase
MRSNFRAAMRTAGLVLASPFLLGAVLLQATIAGPIFKSNNAIPNFVYNTFRRFAGIKVEFNKASAPLSKDPTWFVANHQSVTDFIVLGSTLDGTFAGKGDIMRWPLVAPLARAVKYIGIRRVKKEDPNFKKFNSWTIGKIMKNFNAGENTIMFPEGTTTDGSHLAMFRAGLISMLFGEKGSDKKGNEIKLDKDVVVQPIAIKITKIGGEDVADNDAEALHAYSQFGVENIAKIFWNQMSIKETKVELTAFEPLQPSSFADQFALINAAHENVRSVVAPNQSETKKAAIPGVDDHHTDTHDPLAAKKKASEANTPKL